MKFIVQTNKILRPILSICIIAPWLIIIMVYVSNFFIDKSGLTLYVPFNTSMTSDYKKEITTIFKELFINDQITAKEVRLIGEEGEQLGVLPKSEAQDIADKQGLDLVLMSPNANPPVCKLMDYGKYKFDAVKKEKEIRKNQKISEVKEIQLSMRIDDYHINFKLKNAQKILQDGDKVKVSLRMRGREQAYSQNAVEIVKKFVNDLSEYGSIDKEPAIMGKNVFVVINPKKN